MKKPWIKAILWAVSLLLLIIAMVTIGRIHDRRICPEVVITINRDGGDDFITEAEIRDYIRATGDSIRGQRLRELDLHELEILIAENPYVAEAHVFTTVDGTVHVTVKQRKPIVRVENLRDDAFYISDDGKLMPLNPGRPARVMLACGFYNYDIHNTYIQGLNLKQANPEDPGDSALVASPLYKIFRIASYINGQEFLRAQMTQLVMDRNGEFALIPLVGQQLILIGDDSELEEKLGKLEVFYRQGLSVEGWDKYDTINLQYRNQVVCSLK